MAFSATVDRSIVTVDRDLLHRIYFSKNLQVDQDAFVVDFALSLTVNRRAYAIDHEDSCNRPR